ncbi:hypothetical protein COL36_10290 [Bacillus wiedmannii]|uniref:hypothetical protein n=1 Tax=Bacillus wiedmannii TaxID=1890302 RepID=UPI000BF46453|nr:hypothetical protein [Bacillus wiedmannii]PFX61593.1 hypothetical protein COL36_10290 [Bacillus wiedmannii]
MDNLKIHELINVIVNNWRERDVNVQDKLNKILKSKSPKRVFEELNNAIKTSRLKDKNKVTFVVVLALLRRNLDCKKEINRYLNQYGMLNHLYGGLIQFLNGRSDTFKIVIKWNVKDTDNNYSFICKNRAPERGTYLELIKAASLIYDNNSNKFENLLLKDETNLLLLNFIHTFELSKTLIRTLLKDDKSALRRSIGLFLMISPIQRIINNENNTSKKLNNFVKNRIEIAHTALGELKASAQAELLVNYFLYNKSQKRFVFLEKLMVNPLLKEDLINEIHSNKVRTLEDILILLLVIRDTRTQNYINIRFKGTLYNAITDKIQFFIESDTGIHTWDIRTEKLFESICDLLPKKNKTNFKRYIQKINQNLMTSRIDELVRYDMYRRDISKSKIISEMDKVITTNLSEY